MCTSLSCVLLTHERGDQRGSHHHRPARALGHAVSARHRASAWPTSSPSIRAGLTPRPHPRRLPRAHHRRRRGGARVASTGSGTAGLGPQPPDPGHRAPPIVVDPAVQGGYPVIAGTPDHRRRRPRPVGGRVSASSEILDEYPDLTAADVEDALELRPRGRRMSRLLLDDNLSPALAEALRWRGHDAVHVNDVGLRTAPDAVICRAGRRGWAVVTHDADYLRLLRDGVAGPSVIHLAAGRSAITGATRQAEALRPRCRSSSAYLMGGASVPWTHAASASTRSRWRPAAGSTQASSRGSPLGRAASGRPRRPRRCAGGAAGPGPEPSRPDASGPGRARPGRARPGRARPSAAAGRASGPRAVTGQAESRPAVVSVMRNSWASLEAARTSREADQPVLVEAEQALVEGLHAVVVAVDS